MQVDVLKFVRTHKFFKCTKLSYHLSVYTFYISRIYLLVIIYYIYQTNLREK